MYKVKSVKVTVGLEGDGPAYYRAGKGITLRAAVINLVTQPYNFMSKDALESTKKAVGYAGMHVTKKETLLKICPSVNGVSLAKGRVFVIKSGKARR
jgi:hypothetical protein